MNLERSTQIFGLIILFSLMAFTASAEEAPWGPKIIKLEDITISCEAYEKYYRDIVEDAAKNNSPKWNAAAKSRLDEAFGTYKTAWIKSSTWIMDKYGKKLPTHKSIHDIECETKYKNVSYSSSSGHHSGGYHQEPYLEKKHTYDQIRLGYVDDCKISVAQDIWPELGKCGTGTIIRNFTIGAWCGSQEYTLRLTQKIHVVPSCSFSKQMLHIPDVQYMCAPIKYEDNNHIKLPDYIKPVTLYQGWESTCHSSKIYVSYHDKHYKLIQEHRKYVIIRTWVFSDQCSGKKLEAEQKIMVDGLCRDDEDPDKPEEPDPDKPKDPDKDTVQFALLSPLDDIYISHATYLDTYKDVVDLSLETFRKGQTELSAELLNAIFGSYKIHSDPSKVDSVTVYSMECNDGDPIDTEFKVKNGVIQSDCPAKLTIHQRLSEEFTNCGATGLVREFIVESICDTVTMRDTFTQKIVFSPTCALTSAVFEVPADTVLCGVLQKDTNNRIVLPVDDQPRYIGDSMRSFEVEYKFLVSYSSDDPARTEVTRVWTYTDTCQNDTTMLTQELVLMDTCQSNLDRTMTREIVQTLTRENIEWGIADEVKLEITEGGSIADGELTFAYPNPFTREVGVNFYQKNKGQTQIRILDSRGQFISDKRMDLEVGSHQIYLSGDQFRVPGIYILQILSGDQIENLRVMYQAD